MSASSESLMAAGLHRTAPQWLGVVLHQERRGELLAACDLADRGLEEHPNDVDLAYRAVLALARTGATLAAERRFFELGLASVESEDVAALGARIEKDRALAAVGEARASLATQAALSYQRIADRHFGYFPAINAATLRLVSGDASAARSAATEVLEYLDRLGEVSYYAAATRAEAELLLGEAAHARTALEEAARLCGDDYGALSTTRRQLRMICDLTGVDSGLLAVLAGPAVAFYCGHTMAGSYGDGRPRRFDEIDAAARIADSIVDRPVAFAYGSLAGGADILWAEALLASGAELHVVLPFGLEDFVEVSVEPSGSEWAPRFRRCLEEAVSVTYATEGRYLGDDALFCFGAEVGMGLALLRARFLDGDVFQLALWDGMSATGPVGTAVDVATWQQTGRPVLTLAPRLLVEKVHEVESNHKTLRDENRVIRALLVGDLRGFSGLCDEQIPIFAREVLGALDTVLLRYGNEIEYSNTWGDALIVVLHDASAAAHLALDIQEAMAALDREQSGLPSDLALRLSGHIGPVFSVEDPILHAPTFMGTHINLVARMEPVTPPGAVYVTEAFAAELELVGNPDLRCDYVGHIPTAKDYGRIRMYHLGGRTTA
ncbi:MAG: tetratricopeptide repeat-containing protein [Acidimicrobiales bacterium]